MRNRLIRKQELSDGFLLDAVVVAGTGFEPMTFGL
jgi:hypothetical protein